MAEWLSDIRMRTIATAQRKPDPIPSQSPIFWGIGKRVPRPKMVNIPSMANNIAIIRLGVIKSPKNIRANIVAHIGVR